MKGYSIYSILSYKGRTVKTGVKGSVYGVFVNDKLIFSTNDDALAYDKASQYFNWMLSNLI